MFGILLMRQQLIIYLQAMAEEAYDDEPREAGLRGPGRFDPAIDIETDDSVERFIAFTEDLQFETFKLKRRVPSLI